MADQRTSHRNVVLTGFMGTGKTTVGRILAHLLGYEFVDTDAVIEARHGPIPAIFADQGERAFRAFEREIATELADRRGLVIATGGRMMVDTDNARRLGATGDVFCLTASIDTILDRVDADADGPPRPMLAGDDLRGGIERLLADRADAYARFTPLATDGRRPTVIADEIVRLVRS